MEKFEVYEPATSDYEPCRRMYESGMTHYFADTDGRLIHGVNDRYGICQSTEARNYYNFVQRLDVYSEVLECLF